LKGAQCHLEMKALWHLKAPTLSQKQNAPGGLSPGRQNW
jgi:hypothetical protein